VFNFYGSSTVNNFLAVKLCIFMLFGVKKGWFYKSYQQVSKTLAVQGF